MDHLILLVQLFLSSHAPQTMSIDNEADFHLALSDEHQMRCEVSRQEDIFPVASVLDDQLVIQVLQYFFIKSLQVHYLFEVILQVSFALVVVLLHALFQVIDARRELIYHPLEILVAHFGDCYIIYGPNSSGSWQLRHHRNFSEMTSFIQNG